MVLHQTLWNSVPSREAHSIHVEQDVREFNPGHRGESRAAGIQSAAGQGGELRRIRRVIEVGVEIRCAVVGVIGVGQPFPTEAQIERQPFVDTPIVQAIDIDCIEGDGDEILQLPLAEIAGIAEQEIRKPDAGVP